MKQFLFVLIIFYICEAFSACKNVHCTFEYTGYSSSLLLTSNDFIKCSILDLRSESYFPEKFLPFRNLNWRLYNLEKNLFNKDMIAISNEVESITTLLDGYMKGEIVCENNKFTRRLGLNMIEKIEYSLARMVLSDERDLIIQHIDFLVPDKILNENKALPSWHSLATFKKMLKLSVFVENYYDREGCYPLGLNSLCISDQCRKCACGRDIEYEYHADKWMLRSRCESYDGGLKFDEYIPMIYNQRKFLDLCFSPTFNKKRASLFCGEEISDDDRIKGIVVHDPSIQGIHGVLFNSMSAGCGRIVPLSEQKIRPLYNSVSDR